MTRKKPAEYVMVEGTDPDLKLIALSGGKCNKPPRNSTTEAKKQRAKRLAEVRKIPNLKERRRANIESLRGPRELWGSLGGDAA